VSADRHTDQHQRSRRFEVYMIVNNGDRTFSVTRGGEVVFTGPVGEAMVVHARLSVAARPASKTSDKMTKRDERKQAGVR
jgi:hypothetical protein